MDSDNVATAIATSRREGDGPAVFVVRRGIELLELVRLQQDRLAGTAERFGVLPRRGYNPSKPEGG